MKQMQVSAICLAVILVAVQGADIRHRRQVSNDIEVESSMSSTLTTEKTTFETEQTTSSTEKTTSTTEKTTTTPASTTQTKSTASSSSLPTTASTIGTRIANAAPAAAAEVVPEDSYTVTRVGRPNQSSNQLLGALGGLLSGLTDIAVDVVGGGLDAAGGLLEVGANVADQVSRNPQEFSDNVSNVLGSAIEGSRDRVQEIGESPELKNVTRSGGDFIKSGLSLLDMILQLKVKETERIIQRLQERRQNKL